MFSGRSIFGARGSSSQVFAQWVSLIRNIGGSCSRSIAMAYWFRGANASPLILL